MGTEEVEEMKFKCLFYNTRTCHVREQIDITDDLLKKNLVTGKTFRYREDVPHLNDEVNRNIADWLVNEFCRICPHRER